MKLAPLIIDVQQELFMKSTPVFKDRELLENILLLAGRAHRAGVPVFYIQHSDEKTLVYGSPGWQLHPALHPTEMDKIIHKRHGNAFEETMLDQELKSCHIDSLVVMGLVTHGCVRATCLGGKELGYQVILVADGHSSYSKQAGRLIDEWNQKLMAEGVELLPACEISFEMEEGQIGH